MKSPVRGTAPAAAELAWHPATLGALALLLLNDHLLKPWGGLPWLTGKLSDVAGVFVLPVAIFVLASFVFPRRLRAAAVVSLAAVGLFFTLVKTWPDFNACYSRCLAASFGAAGIDRAMRIRVDPTDLLALPALFGSWRLMRRTLPAPSASGPDVPSKG